MSRISRKREHTPLPTVKTVEVSDKNRKWKIVAIVLLLALGVTLIATAVSQMLLTKPGWEKIQASGNMQGSCAGDFVFLYLLGESDQAANLEQQQLSSIYTQATKDAYQIFQEEELFDGVHNVAYLNNHPNEEVEIPASLYHAFELLQQYQNRAIYMAPFYREYVGMFLSSDDYVAKTYLPEYSPERTAYFEEMLSFATDANAVRLELLENSCVKLVVSDAYTEFAQKNEITSYLDFYWMKNAFIADYLAEKITSAGYYKGTISSFDGFSRNLDTSDRSYQLNIFDRVDKNIYQGGVLEYSGVQSTVSLRNYPMSDLAIQLYYQWKDGSITSCHIDYVDGKSKTAVNDFVGYSRSLTCGEILMKLYPLYVANELDMSVLQSLPRESIETVYCKDYVIYTSDNTVTVSALYQKNEIKYTWKKDK